MKASDRVLLREKFGGRCAYCGEQLGAHWHADHVEPVVRDFRIVDGRTVATGKLLQPQNDRMDNLFPACPPCNLDKHSMPLETWRAKLERSCDVLRSSNSTYRHAMRFGMVCETPRRIVFHFERNSYAERVT